MPKFYAHTKTALDGTIAPTSEWEPLFSEDCKALQGEPCAECEALDPQHGHLNKVAYLTGKFAAEMFPSGHPDREAIRKWGDLAGLWHDLGKFSQEFQTYLTKAGDIHCDEVLEKIDHTSAGAKLAASKNPFPLGHTLATAIAGHHAGLLDARHESRACLIKRLSKEIASVDAAPACITDLELPTPPSYITQSSSSFTIGFFQRMIYSCLVDADFLATEAFMNEAQNALRPQINNTIFEDALQLLQQKIDSFGSPIGEVNKARATVVKDCQSAADSPSGLFSLTVPTGGGKTLSSLAFALKHAIKYGHKRIIYVIPFTSIIEQNAGVFEDLLADLGPDVVLEHHSNLSPEKETTRSRLATENWDAPIVVTTAVQFYESLFAAKTSQSRKLHNIGNSVVILDEAQALPVQYLKPCLRALEQLSSHYHTTTVLCTATQPAVGKTTQFDIGLDGITEIIRDTSALFASLKRVEVRYRETLDDPTIIDEIGKAEQALCIVNTRKHAQALYQLLPQSDENYHLSALMCPEHRLQILATVRQRLDDALPTRLISTQLIEAGVDIDFPTVYRSMAGLDSISQAAGRCNRNGKLHIGHVHIFHSEHTASEVYFRETANVGHEILDLHAEDPLSTAAVNAYFDKYYYQQKSKWDSKDIMSDFEIVRDETLPLLFQYKSAADKFKLIENNQIPIIIPWDEKAKELCNQLRNESIPLHRKLFRSLQRYTVQIYENQFRKNHHQFETLRDGDFNILICPETHYSNTFGLNLTDEAANAKTLIY
ncbi:MAG: CRISPR-associated endonuclease/helicase Cas3 [Lentimonas sp.]|jgi:CRISPR-associated endonuclease/helicase Cas3